jgi:hypothetical protein
MTFKKNVERENKLLAHWRIGATVKKASLLSGVPEGSVSYYYRRFNRDKEKYLRIVQGKFQEPPRTNPNKALASNLNFTQVLSDLFPMIQEKEYGKARDYLQFVLLLEEFTKKHQYILDNIDSKIKPELINKMNSEIINFYFQKNLMNPK